MTGDGVTFFLVSGGAPMDSIRCRYCLPVKSSAIAVAPLHAADMQAILDEEGSAGCELCGVDFPRAELRDGAYDQWIASVFEALAPGRRGENLDRLRAAVSFRDYYRAAVGRAIAQGRDADAEREAVALAHWAAKIPASVGGWIGDASRLREAGLC